LTDDDDDDDDDDDNDDNTHVYSLNEREAQK